MSNDNTTSTRKRNTQDSDIKSFDCVPTEYALHPPMRSPRSEPLRDSLVRCRWSLTVFSDAVLWGLVRAARMSLAQDRHDAGLKAGKKEIEAELGLGARKKKQHRVAVAGRHGYRKGKRRAAKRPPPDEIQVIASPYQILRWAGLSVGPENYEKLPAVVDRLLRPVSIGGIWWPSPLRECDELPRGRFRLVVDVAWLPNRAFTKIPAGGPVRSVQAGNLYYFLHAIQTNADDAGLTDLTSLCRRLDIALRSPSHARHAIDRALAQVNAVSDTEFEFKVRKGKVQFRHKVREADESPKQMIQSRLSELRAIDEFGWARERRTNVSGLTN